MNATEFQAAVLNWFDLAGRKHLPWQSEPTPYRVWVSEIMLQQTQVVTVIPYFSRFMASFPQLADLACASEDEVLSHWAGLGYYARARNLHRAAKALMSGHQGEWPADLAALAKLPGIGRSTAGAILSLAMGIRAPILDGNVKRVLARYAAIDGWPGDAKTAAELWRLSDSLTPDERAGDYNQAMMDLGATVCTRSQPHCAQCPLRQGCLALKLNLTAELPRRKAKPPLPCKRCLMLALLDGEGLVYLEKRPGSGVWGGLWSFPEFASLEAAEAWCRAKGIIARLEAWPERRHTFSHFHLDYTPLVATAPRRLTVSEGGAAWFDVREPIAAPAPVTQLLAELDGLNFTDNSE